MIRLPLWKVVRRKDKKGNVREYAEILLRCHTDEYCDARAKIEAFGTIQLATDAILRRFDNQQQDFSIIIDEIQRQHEQQLDVLKKHLKEHFSNFVYAKSNSLEAAEESEQVIDDIWETIET